MNSSLRAVSTLVIATTMALSVTSVLSKAAPEGKCHGLALAAGESQGPYQAGAIIAMLEEFAK